MALASLSDLLSPKGDVPCSKYLTKVIVACIRLIICPCDYCSRRWASIRRTRSYSTCWRSKPCYLLVFGKLRIIPVNSEWLIRVQWSIALMENSLLLRRCCECCHIVTNTETTQLCVVSWSRCTRCWCRNRHHVGRREHKPHTCNGVLSEMWSHFNKSRCTRDTINGLNKSTVIESREH